VNLPDWSTPVWINVINSISVATCFLVFLIFGHIRRGRLHLVQDAERWAVSGVILWIVTFFVSRGVQVGIKGKTVADPWFLGVGALGSLVCWTAVVVLIAKRDDYGITNDPDWDGKNRRSNGGRRSYDPKETE
jgi:hypothetical protein